MQDSTISNYDKKHRSQIDEMNENIRLKFSLKAKHDEYLKNDIQKRNVERTFNEQLIDDGKDENNLAGFIDKRVNMKINLLSLDY